MEVSSSSPGETEAIAARLARELVVGDVVAVSGELGSGKTTFVRGACRALGVTAPVTSPTYTIGHRYEGHPDVSHLDLYRFTDVSAAEWGTSSRTSTTRSSSSSGRRRPEAGCRPSRASARLEHVDEQSRRIVIDGDVTFGHAADPGLRHRD